MSNRRTLHTHTPTDRVRETHKRIGKQRNGGTHRDPGNKPVSEVTGSTITTTCQCVHTFGEHMGRTGDNDSTRVRTSAWVPATVTSVGCLGVH